jgi:hypothetical protein
MSEDKFKALRVAADEAEMALYAAVRDACPGEHLPIQHRDMNPPWCRFCGRDNDGRQWHAPTTAGEGERGEG